MAKAESFFLDIRMFYSNFIRNTRQWITLYLTYAIFLMNSMKIILILLILIQTCCDLSTPPLMEESHPALSRIIEEDNEWEPVLSVLIPPDSGKPLPLVRFGNTLSLPSLFSPLSFTGSTCYLGEEGFIDVPSLVRDFYRIELYGTTADDETDEKHMCTVTVSADNCTYLKYSVNGKAYYTQETELPVEVNVRAETENRTKVRYLSAGISFRVTL
ncbi:MAG: hypothetical protein ACI4NM_04700 [Bullifex sp.]